MVGKNLITSKVGLFVIATILLGTTSSVYAESMPVTIDGITHDIEYTTTGITVDDIVVDLDFGSLIFKIDSTNNGVLEVTFLRDVFDSQLKGQDDEFFVFVDGEDITVDETETTDTSRTLSIEIAAGSEEVDIIGTVFNKGNAVEEPIECSADIALVCGVDKITYDNMCKLEKASIVLDHTGECVEDVTCSAGEILENGVCVSACSEGTVYVDGACMIQCSAGEVLEDGVCESVCGKGTVYVDGTCTIECSAGETLVDGVCDSPCGSGLVFEDDVCVIDETYQSGKTGSVNSKSGLIYGAIGGFGVAFVVILVLAAMARASRSSN